MCNTTLNMIMYLAVLRVFLLFAVFLAGGFRRFRALYFQRSRLYQKDWFHKDLVMVYKFLVCGLWLVSRQLLLIGLIRTL